VGRKKSLQPMKLLHSSGLKKELSVKGYNISVLIYIQRMLNKLWCSRCEEKKIVTNEMAGFGGLNLFIYLFIIFWLLSELKIK
jgi:hypothetical protein